MARTFAQCSGRLSALMEHQFIVDGPASDRTKAERDQMVELLESVAGQGAQLMQWRISAKVAQAEMLARLRLDPGNERLRKRAIALVQECRALIGAQS